MKNALAHALWSKAARITTRKVETKKALSVVSFTFDDPPLSALANGGKILEEYGYRGTYYVSAGLIGRKTAVGEMADLETIGAFSDRGHEIANHTYDHLDCPKTSFWKIVGSIRRNRNSFPGMMSGSFAYPFGAVDAKSRVAASFCTTSARGISPGINRNVIDLLNLKAARLYDREGVDGCMAMVKECSEKGGWLIFYTHDVCDEPSNYGCTPEQLTGIVRTVSENRLTVTTVGGALKLIESNSRKNRSRRILVFQQIQMCNSLGIMADPPVLLRIDPTDRYSFSDRNLL